MVSRLWTMLQMTRTVRSDRTGIGWRDGVALEEWGCFFWGSGLVYRVCEL